MMHLCFIENISTLNHVSENINIASSKSFKEFKWIITIITLLISVKYIKSGSNAITISCGIRRIS